MNFREIAYPALSQVSPTQEMKELKLRLRPPTKVPTQAEDEDIESQNQSPAPCSTSPRNENVGEETLKRFVLLKLEIIINIVMHSGN